MTIKTFPGAYTSITDASFITPVSSPFKPGLIGVASRGPFGVPTPVASLSDYINKFGNPISTTYSTDSNGIATPNGAGFFLADAVDALAGTTSSIMVVRVGNQYTALAPADGYSSGGNSYVLYSPNNASRIQSLLTQGSVFLRVVQPGLPSTVNATVVSAGNGTIVLSGAGPLLAATYGNNAAISYCAWPDAANSAEGVLYAYTYGSNSAQTNDAVYTLAGSISGYKSDYQFYCSANATSIAVGDVYKIKQANLATTHEVRVKSTLINSIDTSGTIFLEKTAIAQLGYQALSLQDNYTNAVLYKATGKTQFLNLKAASDGTWANGQDSTQGLYVKVLPGSNAGTKKLEVYWNSTLVETWDNISDNPSDTVNFWTAVLAKGNSNYVYADASTVNTAFSANPTAANTVNPWDARFFGSNVTAGLPVPMPLGAINAGWLAVTVGNVQDTGGQFTQGYNGENPQDSDWVGDLNPATDTLSGIKAFEQTDLVRVNVIGAPQDNISLAVMQQLATTASKNNVNAVTVCDVPAGLTARQAIDWHNGKLPSQSGYRLDSRNVAIYWNWFTRSNSWGETKLVPPTIGLLKALANVFNVSYPWTAAAGLNYGAVTDALAVQFNYVSEDVKQSMYGNGNSVNPLLNIQNSFYIFGERTMQRAESKLTAFHSVILVNWIVNGMADIARQFIFDPNDAQLLVQLNLAFTGFLDSIVNNRGLEQYKLELEATASERNNREVVVNLSVIPVDVAERIYINATVFSSGATLNSVS